jgi:protein ImuB
MGGCAMNGPAELYVCLYVREFPAQALLRLRPELRARACVVMGGEPPLEHVASMNRKARALGVIRGMTRVEVDTFPDVRVLRRSQNEEVCARTAVLECVGAFSPRIEAREEESSLLCMLDIAGTERLFGPPEQLARQLLARVSECGIAGCAAVSRNFCAAIALAKGMPAANKVQVVPEGKEASALAPLPLAVLDLAPEQAETFALWGIRTLGDLAALPENELIARMGQVAKYLCLLARGEAPHFFQPMEATFCLEERMDLDSPVEVLDALLFAVNAMLGQLIQRAAARVLALASVTVTLRLEGGATHARSIRSALPSNDRQIWLKLIQLDFEAHPPAAAILGLTVAAEPGSTSKVQLGLFSPQLPEPSRLDVTLARIRAIVGEDCIGAPVLKDSHRPHASGMEPFVVKAPTGMTMQITPTRSALRVLRPAEEISITIERRRPAVFVFRGRSYTVERAYGPWLTSGEWWAPTLWNQEQWDLVARSPEGNMLCCCAVRDSAAQRWKMTALYD